MARYSTRLNAELRNIVTRSIIQHHNKQTLSRITPVEYMPTSPGLVGRRFPW